MDHEDVITSGREHTGRRTALAAVGGGLAVIALGAGGLAVAGAASADSSPAPTTTTTPTTPSEHGPGMGGHGFGGPGHFGIGLGAAVHGTAVVAKTGGGYQTVAFQRGTVTALTATSVTVESTDGYIATYVINSTTKFGHPDSTTATTGHTWLKLKAEVSVEATVAGSINTAVHIGDGTKGPGDRAPGDRGDWKHGTGTRPTAPPTPQAG